MLEEELLHAFERNEFTLYLQPKVDIDSGKIVGGEALARWVHPQEGLLTPVHFIAKMEEMGLVAQLDMYMIERVCYYLSKWKRENRPLQPIAVNLSQLTLATDQVAQKIKALIEHYQVDTKLLEIEVTESIMCTSNKVISQLKDLGLKIAMDDFGTGYSSLAILKQLPVDIVKIDREFLVDIEGSKENQAILETIVALLNVLEKEIVVEGVESTNQLAFIKKIGCRYAQGFLFDKPMCSTAYAKRLAQK